MATAEAQIQATGRRKTAVASVKLSKGTGAIKVNGREFEEYFPTTNLRDHALFALEVSENSKKFDLIVKTSGGGAMGQAGALRLAIARALLKLNPESRVSFREHGLLTRDPRSKERKKPGQPGARKRFQFSKR